MVEYPEMLTAKDAAAYAGVSRMTLWRWVRAGRLAPALVVARAHYYFDPVDLDAAARATVGAPRSTSTPHKPIHATVQPTSPHKPVHEHEEHATATSAPYKPTSPHKSTSTHTSPPARRSIVATYDPDLD